VVVPLHVGWSDFRLCVGHKVERWQDGERDFTHGVLNKWLNERLLRGIH
jgi:hypothetical protein